MRCIAYLTLALVLFATACSGLQVDPYTVDPGLRAKAGINPAKYITPPPNNGPLFVQLRNLGPNLPWLERKLNKALAGKGYTLVSDPDEAGVVVQLTTLAGGESDATLPKACLAAGPGAPVSLPKAKERPWPAEGNVSPKDLWPKVTYLIVADLRIYRRSNLSAKSLPPGVDPSTGKPVDPPKKARFNAWPHSDFRIVTTVTGNIPTFAQAAPALENQAVKKVLPLF